MKTKIIYSEHCLEYGGIASPENSQRVLFAAQVLKDKGYEFIAPRAAAERDILAVHDKGYVEAVKNGDTNDPDTPAYEGIFEYAKLAAGGAIDAAKAGGFSLMRPPGHHCGTAGKALGAFTRGFCYFNNLAIAVRALNKKTVIIDFDGHHGNGTQEIFDGDKKVTYLSLHRNNVFPQTGSATCGNCHNYPLAADCGGKIYLQTFKKALEAITPKLKTAQLVAVSAGFDARMGDIVSLGLLSEDYYEIGREIKRLDKPVFSVLEGGYDPKKLGADIDAYLQGLAGA
jgi:acetoin utilization deacetylase AcuC-like enzyme